MSKTTATPNYNTAIPEQIMTPDTVETRIGTLKFFDGLPTDETVAESLRPSRLSARRRGVPQLHPGHVDGSDSPRRGGARSAKSNQAIIFDQLMDSNSLFLTPNTDTVYCFASSIWRRTVRRSSRFRPVAGRAR